MHHSDREISQRDLEPRLASLERSTNQLTNDRNKSASTFLSGRTDEDAYEAYIASSNKALCSPSAASKFLHEAKQQMLMSTYDANPGSYVKRRDPHRDLIIPDDDRCEAAVNKGQSSNWDIHQQLRQTPSTRVPTSPSRSMPHSLPPPPPPPPPIIKARDPFCERIPAPRHAAFSEASPTPRPPTLVKKEKTSPPFSARDKMMLQTYCDTSAPVDKYYRGGFGGDGSMFVRDDGSYTGGSRCVKTAFFTPDADTGHATKESQYPAPDVRMLDFDDIEYSFSTINDEENTSAKATIRQLEDDVKYLENALERAQLDSSRHQHALAIAEKTGMYEENKTTTRDDTSIRRHGKDTSRVSVSNDALISMQSSSSSKSTLGSLQKTVKEEKPCRAAPRRHVENAVSAAFRMNAAVRVSGDTPLTGESSYTSTRQRAASAVRPKSSSSSSERHGPGGAKNPPKSPTVHSSIDKQHQKAQQKGGASPGRRFLAQHYNSLWVGYGPAKAPGSPPTSPPWK